MASKRPNMIGRPVARLMMINQMIRPDSARQCPLGLRRYCVLFLCPICLPAALHVFMVLMSTSCCTPATSKGSPGMQLACSRRTRQVNRPMHRLSSGKASLRRLFRWVVGPQTLPQTRCNPPTDPQTGPQAMTNCSEPCASLAAQLQEALAQLQALGLKVANLEARLQARETPTVGPGPVSSGLDFLDRHRHLHLPGQAHERPTNTNGSAAERLRHAQGRPPTGDSAAASAGPQPRPSDVEVPMSATRMVMAQIVSPGDSLGLDICNVRGWHGPGPKGWALLAWCFVAVCAPQHIEACYLPAKAAACLAAASTLLKPHPHLTTVLTTRRAAPC